MRAPRSDPGHAATRRRRSVSRAVPIAMILAVTTGCDLILEALPDDRAPQVRVLVPAGSDAVITSEAGIQIEGVAMDDRSVERITVIAEGRERDLAVARGAAIRFAFGGRSGSLGDTIEIRAYDAGGNQGSTRIPAPVHDVTGPVIELTEPSDSLAWTDGTFRVAGSASDDHGADRVVVEYSYNRLPYEQLAVLPARFDTTLTVHTTIAVKASIRVTAHDLAGNRTAVMFRVPVDPVPPRISFHDSRPLSVRESDARFYLRVDDEGASGVDSVRYVAGNDTVLAGVGAYSSVLSVPSAPGWVRIVADDEIGNVARDSLAWLDAAFVDLHGVDRHACMLQADGAGYCVGRDWYGQLGEGPPDASGAGAVRVAGSVAFVSIRTGITTTCGIDGGGSAYCWGANRTGQLGDGSLADRSVPTPVAGGHVFTEIHPAEHSTCALDDTGTAFCWGLLPRVAANGGVIWDTVVSPRAVAASEPFVALRLDPRARHVCALDGAGAAHCWGQALGYDTDADPAAFDTAAVAVSSGPLSVVQPVSAGDWSADPWTFALTQNGEPTTLGGTGNPEQISQDYGTGPYDDVIVDDGWVCALSGSTIDPCPSSRGPAVAQSDASRFGIEAAAFTAAPCFLTTSGSLYCRPIYR